MIISYISIKSNDEPTCSVPKKRSNVPLGTFCSSESCNLRSIRYAHNTPTCPPTITMNHKRAG